MLSHKGYVFPRDLTLLAGVFFLLPYYAFLLKIYPVGKLNAACKNKIPPAETRKIPTAAEKETLDKIYRAATYFLHRLWRSDRPCLRRTLILHRWCCKRGLESKMVVGVQKENGDLKSHAWLEINGSPFKETAAQLTKYTPILEG